MLRIPVNAWLLKIIILLTAIFIPVTQSFAFLYEVQVLDREKIGKLSDAVLLDTYIDTVVEIQASQDFHRTAGFTPKEYKQYKELLRYRINLIQEIKKRKLDLPLTDAQDMKSEMK